MKSARDRAEEILTALGDASPADYPERVVGMLERMFEAHAKDQRHLCGQAVPFLATMAETSEAVTNAPAPGEQR